MTEFFSSILGPLVEKLTSWAIEEIQPVQGIKDERQKLKNMLEMIKKVLTDAEQKQTKEVAVRLWLSKLKELCYDTEDVLDEFEAKALRRQVTSTEQLTLKQKVRFLWLPNFILQFKMADKMKELRERLDGIDEEKTWLNLSSDVYDQAIVQRKETYFFVPISSVIGRNEDKKRMRELLMRFDDGRDGKIAVIWIVGIGGIGKTTLAKLVYMDGRVYRHFDFKVCDAETR